MVYGPQTGQVIVSNNMLHQVKYLTIRTMVYDHGL